MRMKLYQFHDAVAMCMIGYVFPERSDAAAIRQFDQALADEKGPFSRNPADYELFLIAEYDDSNGRLVEGDVVYPISVRRGTSFVAERIAQRSREEANASA